MYTYNIALKQPPKLVNRYMDKHIAVHIPASSQKKKKPKIQLS